MPTQTDDLLTLARRMADVVPCEERAELIGRLCDRLEEVMGQRDEAILERNVAAAAGITLARWNYPGDDEDAAHHVQMAMSKQADPAEAARLAALVFGEGSP